MISYYLYFNIQFYGEYLWRNKKKVNTYIDTSIDIM